MNKPRSIFQAITPTENKGENKDSQTILAEIQTNTKLLQKLAQQKSQVEAEVKQWKEDAVPTQGIFSLGSRETAIKKRNYAETMLKKVDEAGGDAKFIAAEKNKLQIQIDGLEERNKSLIESLSQMTPKPRSPSGYGSMS